MTHSHNDISQLLTKHGLAPRRAFGQNFLVDPNTVRKIARLANVGPSDFVLEIGAGLGSLTLALAETGATIVAVEIDNGVVEVLREVVKDLPNVEVWHIDAMNLDWRPLVARSPKWHVVANLPYNVATPLVADLLDGAPAVDHLLVMVQKKLPNVSLLNRALLHTGQSALKLRTGQKHSLPPTFPQPCFCRNQMCRRQWWTFVAGQHLLLQTLTRRNSSHSCAQDLVNAENAASLSLQHGYASAICCCWCFTRVAC